ncbi:MAG: transposase [Clostridiales bacterium]
MGKRRQFSSEFKVKVVLEMLREERTLSEVASAYEINPNQLATWRREFLEKAPGLFDEPKTIKAQQKAEQASAAEKDRLLKTIGQLTMERDFLQAVQAKREENRRLL